VFAEGDHALFWRIKTRDNRSGIVFGYARIAASLAPDIVRDGERMVEKASHVVLDMNSFTLPTMKMGKLPALLRRLSPAVAAELRDVLAGSGMAQSQLESASAVLVGALAAPEAFFLAPVGMLTGPDGSLERFRRQGADISVLARRVLSLQR
jgi:hypothetical protein